MISRIPVSESFKTVAGWGQDPIYEYILCRCRYVMICLYCILCKLVDTTYPPNREFGRFPQFLSVSSNSWCHRKYASFPSRLSRAQRPSCAATSREDWLEVQINPNRSVTFYSSIHQLPHLWRKISTDIFRPKLQNIRFN